MAQLLIRRLDDDAKERLKARAKKHGRSLEAEARAILEDAANGEPNRLRPRKKEKGFGTLMHERFKSTGLTEEEARLFQQGISPRLHWKPSKRIPISRNDHSRHERHIRAHRQSEPNADVVAWARSAATSTAPDDSHYRIGTALRGREAS